MKEVGMEQKLRNEAKALLEQGKVDYIIGFEPGSSAPSHVPTGGNEMGQSYLA